METPTKGFSFFRSLFLSFFLSSLHERAHTKTAAAAPREKEEDEEEQGRGGENKVEEEQNFEAKGKQCG